MNVSDWENEGGAMAKHSMYQATIISVDPLGYTTQGNMQYKIVAEDKYGIGVRAIRANCTANYDAKKLSVGDVVDLITDGRGNIIVIDGV